MSENCFAGGGVCKGDPCPTCGHTDRAVPLRAWACGDHEGPDGGVCPTHLFCHLCHEEKLVRRAEAVEAELARVRMSAAVEVKAQQNRIDAAVVLIRRLAKHVVGTHVMGCAALDDIPKGNECDCMFGDLLKQADEMKGWP